MALLPDLDVDWSKLVDEPSGFRLVWVWDEESQRWHTEVVPSIKLRSDGTIVYGTKWMALKEAYW